MIYFIKKNWKGLFAPVSCLFITLFDYLIGNSFYFTLIKILIFCLLHALYVYKTEYIYDSDIYLYLGRLKYEYERHHVIKPFLTLTQITLIYISLAASFCLQSFDFFKPFYLSVFSILFALLILDSLNIFLRSLTNKAELKNIKPPPSLMQTRFMFITFIKYIPYCVAGSRLVVGTLALTEIAYPMGCASNNRIGPITRLWTNKVLYPELTIPLETRLDVMYESFKYDNNECYIRPKGEPPLPERTCTLSEEQDLLNLGVSQGIINSMTGKSMPSLINMRK